MLQQMREHARGIFGWIIIGAIVLVLSIFGFGALNFFVTSEPVVAEVGGTEITQSRYERLVQRQLQQTLAQLGPEADPADIDEDALRDRVLDSLVERTLLLEGARRAGMGAPEDALDEIIVGTPEFQVDGAFDADRFRVVLASAGLTPLAYREALGEDLVVNQLGAAIGDTGFVTDAELESVARLSRQERDVAWLAFPAADYEEIVEVGDEALRAYYETHSERYRAAEQVSVEYLRLDLADLAAEEEATEEAVRAAYEAELETFEGQEQRRASHILLAVDEDRDEAEAVALLSGLRERVLAGEDFGALAEEYSDDPGSASRGGDLGFAVRGAFVPAFERALFALEEGELSEPVVSQFGVHLIRLEEIARTDPPSLARRRPELEQRIRERAARERFDDLRARLETLAYEAPDLQEPAEALGLEIRRAGPFTRRGGEGDFAQPTVVEAAFSDEVLVGGYNSPILEPREDVLLVLRLDAYEPERLRAYEEVASEVREDLVAERALARALADAEAVLARLEDGASVTGVAAEYDREWSRREGMTRTDLEAPGAVVETAFALPRPPADGRSLGRAELAEGGIAVVTVTAVRPGDLAALTEAQRSQLLRLLERRQGATEFEAFRNALRRDLGVVRTMPES